MKMEKKLYYLIVNILLVESCITHKMNSVRKYPSPPMEGNRNSKGRGSPKGDSFQGGGRLLTVLFFYSFSVEQAFGYFTGSGRVSKQVLLFALIQYLLCMIGQMLFFHMACMIVFFNTIVISS